MATKPKLSSSDVLPTFFNEAIPNARASIKGTVNAPVVAPDASNAKDKNSLDVNRAKTKMRR